MSKQHFVSKTVELKKKRSFSMARPEECSALVRLVAGARAACKSSPNARRRLSVGVRRHLALPRSRWLPLGSRSQVREGGGESTVTGGALLRCRPDRIFPKRPHGRVAVNLRYAPPQRVHGTPTHHRYTLTLTHASALVCAGASIAASAAARSTPASLFSSPPRLGAAAASIGASAAAHCNSRSIVIEAMHSAEQ